MVNMASKRKYRVGKVYKAQKATSSVSGNKAKKSGYKQPCVHNIPTLVLRNGKRKFIFNYKG